MLRHRITHVFFDLDRTLWDFDANSKATLLGLFTEFGLKERTGAEAEAFISAYHPINDSYWELYRQGKASKEQVRTGRFLDTLTAFGLPEPELAVALGDAYVLRGPRMAGLVDGAMEVLDYLCGKYALHIITNGFEEAQHTKMHSSGIAGYFGEVITSERAGVKKPDPGIFRFAERVTSSLPEGSVMIGDHLEADIHGARGAGWNAIHLADRNGAGGPSSHHTIRSLAELHHLL